MLISSETINNFPASLIQLIQQNFVEREFEFALKRYGWRNCLIKMQHAQNTAQTCSGHVGNDKYAAIMRYIKSEASELRVTVTKTGIASQFLQTAFVLGEAANKTLSQLVQNEIEFAVKEWGTTLSEQGNKGYLPLTVELVNQAVEILSSSKQNKIGGYYNVYISKPGMAQILADPAFKALTTSASLTSILSWKAGMISDALGVRFISTETLGPYHTYEGQLVNSAYICAEGAVVEVAPTEKVALEHVSLHKPLVNMVDNVLLLTYQPKDKSYVPVIQDWAYVGGFAAPRDSLKGGYARAIRLMHGV